ncbi:hypothetical protein JB92DRAFT_2949108 [Gautieria morchelliformis]|nr:hypothetical protein JB92DRAFT_2949108 [Gautieria morchelliformis]
MATVAAMLLDPGTLVSFWPQSILHITLIAACATLASCSFPVSRIDLSDMGPSCSVRTNYIKYVQRHGLFLEAG